MIIPLSFFFGGKISHLLEVKTIECCLFLSRMSVSQSSRASSQEERPRRQRLPELQPIRVLD